MESVIHNNIEGFLLLLLSMWPILLVVFIGVAISFYTMLLRKTALACLLFALAIGAAGWSQQPLASGFIQQAHTGGGGAIIQIGGRMPVATRQRTVALSAADDLLRRQR